MLNEGNFDIIIGGMSGIPLWQCVVSVLVGLTSCISCFVSYSAGEEIESDGIVDGAEVERSKAEGEEETVRRISRLGLNFALNPG